MPHPITYLLFPITLFFGSGEHLRAQDLSPPAAKLAATVNGETIDTLEVDRVIHESLRGRQVAESARPLLEAETLARLIDQRLVAGTLDRLGLMPKESEITAAVAALRNKASIDKQPFDEFLTQRRMTEATLRRELAWRLGWQTYIDREINDAALEQFFNAHRKEFDGSQVRASHILWKVESSADGVIPPEKLSEIRLVRQQIVDGKITFSAAAKKHSTGPSKDQGGDIGFFPRHGQMDEAFSKAAFSLEKGQISEPVVSPFGVHLIQCTDVRPGERRWTEVREQLRTRISNEKFAELAQKEYTQAKIELSGLAPHFKPGTRQLVLPARK